MVGKVLGIAMFGRAEGELDNTLVVSQVAVLFTDTGKTDLMCHLTEQLEEGLCTRREGGREGEGEREAERKRERERERLFINLHLIQLSWLAS